MNRRPRSDASQPGTRRIEIISYLRVALTLQALDNTGRSTPKHGISMPDTKYAALRGRMVIVGFGSIGQGVLPLLLRHLDMAPGHITIVTAEPRGRKEAAEYGVRFVETALTRDNYRAVLDPL